MFEWLDEARALEGRDVIKDRQRPDPCAKILTQWRSLTPGQRSPALCGVWLVVIPLCTDFFGGTLRFSYSGSTNSSVYTDPPDRCYPISPHKEAGWRNWSIEKPSKVSNDYGSFSTFLRSDACYFGSLCFG